MESPEALGAQWLIAPRALLPLEANWVIPPWALLALGAHWVIPRASLDALWTHWVIPRALLKLGARGILIVWTRPGVALALGAHGLNDLRWAFGEKPFIVVEQMFAQVQASKVILWA